MNVPLAFATIAEISAMYENRRVSVMEVTELFLNRLAGIGLELNAIARLAEHRARADAQRLDGQGRMGSQLRGIPYGIKDMFSTRDAQPMNGSAIPNRSGSAGDAEVIELLSRHDAILVAALAMQEFGGLHCSDPARSTAGPTRNPWDPQRWSGGSSSGPGAAVAAGLVPFAIGAESGGSIAFPSSYCGITGLRPTFGRLTRVGASILCWTLDKIGPMAHSAEDCRLVFRALTEEAAHITPWSDPRLSGQPLQGFRIGWNPYDFHEAAWPEVQPALRDGLAALTELGATTHDVELPAEVPYPSAIAIVAMSEAAASMRPLVESHAFRSLTLEQQAGMQASREIAAEDYLDASRIRTILIRRLSPIFEKVDAIVSFVTPWPAPPIGQSFAAVPITGGTTGLIMAGNLAGLPGVFLPCGQTASGLPVGLQLVGPPFGDAVLLDVAAHLQAATDWHRAQPPNTPSVPEPPVSRVPAIEDQSALLAKIDEVRRTIGEHIRRIRDYPIDPDVEPDFEFVRRPGAAN